MPGAIVHVSRRLSDVSLHYPSDFVSVGDLFFERKPVEYLTDQFVTANKANLLSIRELTPLGDDDVPPEIQLKWDADTTYNCQVYGVASPGKWITTKMADPSLDYETERAIQLTLSLRLRLEYLQVIQRLRSTTYNTNTSTCTAHTRWDAYGDPLSVPIKQMQAICDGIGYLNNGRKPNRIAMTTHALRACCRSEDFRDQIKYQAIPNAAEIGKSQNGQKFLVEQLIGVSPGTITIADHTYNSAAEGQTAVYKAFMSNDVVFGYVEPLGLRSYSFSAGFQWSAYPNQPTSIISVPQYFRGVMTTEEHRAFTVLDPKILRTDLGYLLKGVIDSTNTADYGTVL